MTFGINYYAYQPVVFMKKKITIQDIANIAGVSKSTVSRSLNDNSMIAEKTRDRIKKIARDHNFEFNVSARNLSLNETNTIGIITSDDQKTTDYMNLLIDSVRSYFENCGIDIIIAHPNNKKTGESNIRRLIRTGKVSGLFIVSPHVKIEDWQFLRENNFPVVISHFRPQNISYNQFNYFLVDNEYGGFIATEHLIQKGCKNILTITEDGGQQQFLDRTAGYMRSLKENGLPFSDLLLIEGECTYDFGYQSIIDRKGLLHKIDGIFVQADIMAVGVINALKDLEIQIPDRIAIVGFDDLNYSSYLRPALTTIHQPRKKMIEWASQCLFDSLNNKQNSKKMQMIFQPELIIRQSCPLLQ